MHSIITLGFCPSSVRARALELISRSNFLKSYGKKVSGLKSHYSVKLPHGYRLLISFQYSKAFIGNHNQYEKKIHNLKKQKPSIKNRTTAA